MIDREVTLPSVHRKQDILLFAYSKLNARSFIRYACLISLVNVWIDNNNQPLEVCRVSYYALRLQ